MSAGGVLSPLLWNLVVDKLLTITYDLGFSIFGYVDDIVIIVQGKFAHTVREIMQEALNVVVKWAVKEGLNISPHKTAIVPFTNRRNAEGLGPLILYGKELTMLDRIKYLGVTLDFKLHWNQHLQKIINIAQTTFAIVRRTCGKKWDLRPNMVHWLYTSVIRPPILHGALVWWPKAMQKITKTQLGRIQRMACLAFTGAMKSTPTAAMEILLNLTPLDLVIQAESRMALYRLHIPKQPAEPKAEAGLLSIWKNVSDPLLGMRMDHTTPFYYYSKVISVIIDWDHWKNKDPVFPEDALIWFTDGSRANSGTGSGIFGLRPNRRFSFPLGKFATVFQTEIYAILKCACENIRRAYKNKRILIFSESQAALKALSSQKLTSRLVAECLDALPALASLNEITLTWVPGHRSISGNEEADKLVRQASATPLLCPEPAVGIPKCSVREAINNWTEMQHLRAWIDLPGLRHGKLFIDGSCKKRADDLLKLGRHQLKMVIAIYTGHVPVRGHLYTMGLFDGDPICRFCGMETETVQHIICCCEALARQRYYVFGRLTVEPKDISPASIRDLCLFIRGAGLLRLCLMKY